MKRTLNRILSAVMALVMVFTLLPVSALAVEDTPTSGKCGENVYWTFDSSTGTLTISGEGKMWDYDFSHNPPWISFLYRIKTLVVKAGVSRIGTYAFPFSSTLTSLSLPKTLKSIGNSAFIGCDYLSNVKYYGSIPEWKQINIGSDNTCIRDNIVVCIDESESEWVASGIANENIIWKLSIDHVMYFSGKGFLTANGSSFLDESPAWKPWCGHFSSAQKTTVVIEQGITGIESGLFGFCWDIEKVIISESVSDIQEQVFYGLDCEIEVAENNRHYKSIDGALYDKTGETLLFYPHREEIVEIPEGVKHIGVSAFEYGSMFKTIILPDSLETIGANAFAYNSSLTEIAFGSGIKQIGTGAFTCCDNLTTVNFKGSKAQWDTIKDDSELDKLNPQYNFDDSDDSEEENGTQTSLRVFYFRKWDAANKTAHWGEEPAISTVDFGSQVNDNTDLSAVGGLEGIGQYAGSYVLAETKPRDDGMVGADTLVRITPVETKYGFVDAMDNINITIGGKNYEIPELAKPLFIAVDDYVMYHLLNGKLVAISLMEQDDDNIRYFSNWDAESGLASFGMVNLSIAKLSEQTDKSFLSDIDHLLGSYVWLETVRGETVDEIISITPLQSQVGTITAIDADWITINRTTLPISDPAIMRNLYIGEHVLFHVSAEKVVGIETLYTATGDLIGYHPASTSFSIKYHDTALADSQGSYQLSTHCDSKAKDVLNKLSSGNVTIVSPIQILTDQEHFVYMASELEYGLYVYTPYPRSSVAVNEEIELMVEMRLGADPVFTEKAFKYWFDESGILELSRVEPGITDRKWHYYFSAVSSGTVNVTFADPTDTGNSVTVPISVGEGIDYYGCSKINGEHESYDAIHIANYKCVEHDNGTHTISFDAYNSTYSYGSVEVYNNENKLIKIVALKPKYEGSGLEAFFNSINYGIVEPFTSKESWFARKSFSQHTPISLKNIPNDSKIVITRDGSRSLYTTIYSLVDIFVQTCFAAHSIVDLDNVEVQRETVEALVQKIFEKASKESISELAKSLTDAAKKNSTMTAIREIYNILFDAFSDFNIDVKDTIEAVLKNFGLSLGDTALTTFIPMMSVFNIVMEVSNVAYSLSDYAIFGMDTGSMSIFVTAHNEQNYRINNNITVSQTGNFNSDTILNAYPLDDNEVQSWLPSLPEGLSDYCVYNITLLEKGVEIQPSQELEMRLPVPDGAVPAQCAVFRVEADSECTRLSASVDGNYLVVKTDHLSYYIVGEESSTSKNKCGDNATWSLDLAAGTLTISGSGEMYNYTPDNAGGSDTPWNELRSRIRSIVIQDGITAVGDYAFIGCKKATEVSWSDSMTTIGVAAFEECDGLKTLDHLNSVSIIKDYAFIGCDGFVELDIPDSVTSVGTCAFDACSKLKKITLPDSVTELGSQVFGYCENLKEVKLPKPVTEYKKYMFWYCTSLKKFTIGDTVETIGLSSFADCPKLAVVIIPSSVRKIDAHAFSHCYSLRDIHYGGSEADWAAIDIASNAIPEGVVIHYNSDGPAVIPNPFTDISESDYFYAPVMWAYENDITGGMTGNLFAPNDSCTRAQVVTFLWAANGKPAPVTMSYDNPFTDVDVSDWYYQAVMWATENGITGGIGEGLFGPNETCTRAQIVTFLYAAQGKPPVSGSSDFSDVANTDWYANAVLWAAQNDITGGIGEGLFGPNNTCTRGQVVTFLYKVYNK